MNCDMELDTLEYRWIACPGKGNTTEELCVEEGCCFNGTLSKELSLNCVQRVKR